MAFTDDPRFQKRIRKRMNVDPSQSAIVDTGDIAAEFAGEQERRQIVAGSEASSLDLRKRGFEENVRSRTAGEALTRDRASFRESQGRIATGASIAGLGVNIFAGILDIKDSKEREAAFDNRIQQLRQSGDDIEAENLEFIRIIERYKS